jgi:hypothetical protein
MQGEYGCLPSSTNKPPQQLEEAYASILESDFAQPFMGLINNIPVCQLDIYRTEQDAISLYYKPRPGDFGLHVLAAPAPGDHFTELMKSCLDYFFSFPEVGRIIAYPESGNRYMNALYRETGFRWHKKIRMSPYKIADLFICTAPRTIRN